MAILELNDRGLYCAAGDFYIDPWRPVARAVITHAHADHARWGHDHYLAHRLSVPVLYKRVANTIAAQSVEYGERLAIGDVKVSFHPAGHIPGSAQIRVEHKGEVWVVTGDYKREDDGLSTPFEPVRCDTIVSECTFGLPIFSWAPQREIFDQIARWWSTNQAHGVTSVLLTYSLGKAQRILVNLPTGIGQVFAHGAVYEVTEVLRAAGVDMPPLTRVVKDQPKSTYRGGLVLAPPSVLGSKWLRKLEPISVGSASGWMNIRGMKRRRGLEHGFVLSDHGDFEALCRSIQESEAERAYVTHGYTASFARFLRDGGLDAHELKTEFGGDEAPESIDREDSVLPDDARDPQPSVVGPTPVAEESAE